MTYNFLYSIENKPIQTSLSSCLSSLSKFQLTNIANNHKIPNASKIKKVELIEQLEKEILKKIDFLFDYKEVTDFMLCQIFSTLKSHDKTFEELKNNYFADFEMEDFEVIISEKVDYLLSFGFLFYFCNNENETIVFPKELSNKISNYSVETVANFEYLAFYERVLTDLYGICPIDLLHKIYNRNYPHIKIESKTEIVAHVEKIASLNNKIFFENETLYHYKVKENNLEHAILEKRKRFKPYIPTYHELLEKYASDFCEETNPNFHDLIMYLIHKKLSFELANSFGRIIVLHMKCINDPNELLEVVQELSPYVPENIDDANEYLSVILNLYNSIPNWFGWGWIPTELSKIVHSSEKEKAITDEELELLKEQRNNVKPLDLPDNCHIPSKSEILDSKTEFDKYWGNNIIEPVWQSTGDSQLNRLKPYFSKYKKTICDIPEESINMLLDQWLASIWHKKANRKGFFGKQQWNYHVFTIYQQIGDNLFTCIDSDSDKTPFVLYSKAAEHHFENDSFTCLSILIDMGGWFLSYGPIVSWTGLIPDDLHFLAKKTAPQLYAQQGFSDVVQFNPVPFWGSSIISQMPPLSHKNKRIIYCFLECRFKDDKVPVIPKSWTYETVGNLSRWINKSDDYLSSYGIYFDKKTKKVLLFSHTIDDFYKLEEKFSKYLIIEEIEIVSIHMLNLYTDMFKKEPLFITFEKKFE